MSQLIRLFQGTSGLCVCMKKKKKKSIAHVCMCICVLMHLQTSEEKYASYSANLTLPNIKPMEKNNKKTTLQKLP